MNSFKADRTSLSSKAQPVDWGGRGAVRYYVARTASTFVSDELPGPRPAERFRCEVNQTSKLTLQTIQSAGACGRVPSYVSGRHPY